jgi:hypothetical protein
MPGNPLVRFDEGRVGRTARCRLLSYSTRGDADARLLRMSMRRFGRRNWIVVSNHAGRGSGDLQIEEDEDEH